MKVGEIVHYVSYGTPGGEYSSQCRAAIVTEVEGRDPANANFYVSLGVLNPTGLFFNEHLPYAEPGQRRGGTWHPMEECRLVVEQPDPRDDFGVDDRPHSRACGISCRGHGPQCSPDCPTCGGQRLSR